MRTYLQNYKFFSIVLLRLGAVQKRRPQLESGPVRAFFGRVGIGVLQMLTSALFGAKNVGYFEIYGVSDRQVEGLTQ